MSTSHLPARRWRAIALGLVLAASPVTVAACGGGDEGQQQEQDEQDEDEQDEDEQDEEEQDESEQDEG